MTEPLSATGWLAAWEAGRDCPPLDRALELLRRAEPGIARAELERQTPGQWTARVLALRAGLLGPTLDATADCPHCTETLEFRLDTAALGAFDYPDPPASLAVQSGDVTLTFRPPTIADVRRARGDAAVLFAATILHAGTNGSRLAPDALPAELPALAASALQAADPLADIHLDLSCPACEARFAPRFDPLLFFFQELEVWARRTLGEVHRLARAYGWSERDILALTPARRRLYLEMLDA